MSKLKAPQVPIFLEWKNLSYEITLPKPPMRWRDKISGLRKKNDDLNNNPNKDNNPQKENQHDIIGNNQDLELGKIPNISPMSESTNNKQYNHHHHHRDKLSVRSKPPTRTILKNVSGRIGPGEFLAIMGPTGSGKTTILGLLSNRVKKGVTGDLLINGEAPSKDYKRRVSYVLQDDVLFANLTVEQTLGYTAKLRLPHTTTKQKEEKVNEVIDLLNLNKARNTLIGGAFQRGVSGGERKRVNIGNALLANPSLILLDEPTSGLDTSTAVNLLKVLKGMADSGFTVVSSIHQPSSQMFELFDKLLLMVDGQAIYFGPAQQAVAYFSSLGLDCAKFYNPADFMMGLILQEEIRKGNGIKNQLIDAWVEREEDLKLDQFVFEEADNKKIMKKVAVRTGEVKLLMSTPLETHKQKNTPKYAVPFWDQLMILSERSFRQSKGVYFSKLPFVQIIVIALISGLFWLQIPNKEGRIQDKFGALFFVGIFAGGFFPLFNSLYNFPPERAVIQRERAEGAYRLSAYFISKMISEILFELMFPLLFIAIAYPLIGLRAGLDRFLLFCVIVGLLGLTTSGLGFAISSKIFDVKMAGIFASIVMLAAMLVGGFYIQVSQMPVWIRWTHYFSWVKYAYDAMMINEFSGRLFTQEPDVITAFDKDALGGNISGDSILDTRELEVNSILANLGILALFVVGFRVMAFLLLRSSFKPRA